MAMEKEQLRKADLITSVLIFLFGAWVVWMAFQMPMKDSFGGVMNVWYVSPAIFPIFVGAALMTLAMVLFNVALSQIGRKKAAEMVRQLIRFGSAEKRLSDKTVRFFAIAVLLLSYVYMNIPRVDFYLGTLLFLTVFITMFYFDDDLLLRKLFRIYFMGTLFFGVFFTTGLDDFLVGRFAYATDLMTALFILAYAVYCWSLVKLNSELRRKYRLSLIVSLAVPTLLCPVFKYFLLVPLPYEGAVVQLMDAVRYSF